MILAFQIHRQVMAVAGLLLAHTAARLIVALAEPRLPATAGRRLLAPPASDALGRHLIIAVLGGQVAATALFVTLAPAWPLPEISQVLITGCILGLALIFFATRQQNRPDLSPIITGDRSAG